MDATLGRYCIDLGTGVYYDTLRHERLAANQLADRHLLAGQERVALQERLLETVPAFVTVVPSWECNLRCPHCYVGHLLKRPSGNASGDLDPEAVADFMKRVAAHPGWGVSGYALVGGEPLLHPELLRELQRRLSFNYTITTNGMWQWEAMADLLADPKLNILTFSIDGLPEDHNRIRRSLERVEDAFGVVYRNLARAVKAFPDKTIVVQGSMVDADYSDADCERFLALMLLAGVKPDNIRLGVAAESRLKEGGPPYRAMVKTAIRFRPCCDYQAGKQLVIVGDAVYPSYYEVDRSQPLGTLRDDPATILAAQRARIVAAMPILHDETCRDECRAVGICWGLCSAMEEGYLTVKDFRSEATRGRQTRPSSACNRTAKELAVQQVAEKGLSPLETAGVLRRLSLPLADRLPFGDQ